MPMPKITWDDVQQLPDDGNRVFVINERRGIVAPDEIKGAPDLVVEILAPSTAARDRDLNDDAVDVWRFGDEPPAERFVDSLPVRLGAERLGDIDLAGVFAEG